MDTRNIYLTAPDDFQLPSELDASTSRSLPSLPSKRKNPQIRPKGVVIPISEREEVERLSEWQVSSLTTETLSSQDVMNHYRGRFSELDKIVAVRKGKSLFPPLGMSKSEKEIRSTLDLTQKRAIKQERSLEEKEQARYAKLYEDELVSSVEDLQSQLTFLESERQHCRKANTALRAKLFQGQLIRHQSPPAEFHKEMMKQAVLLSLRMRNTKVRASPRISAEVESGFASRKEFEESKGKILQEIEENTHRAEELDRKVQEVRLGIKELRKTQVKHFLEVLAEGRDTRSEGLSWVVKTLWALGQNVPAEAFPLFLDMQTVKVILTLAEKTKEYQALKDISLMQERRQRRASITARAHPDRWNDVGKRLKEIGQNISTKEIACKRKSHEDRLIFIAREDEEREEQRRLMEQKERERGGKMQVLIARNQSQERRIAELEREIAELRETETQRIVSECCFGNLEQKLGVDMKTILSALLGIDVINRQMSTIAKNFQNLVSDQDQTKTFRFGGGRKKAAEESKG